MSQGTPSPVTDTLDCHQYLPVMAPKPQGTQAPVSGQQSWVTGRLCLGVI